GAGAAAALRGVSPRFAGPDMIARPFPSSGRADVNTDDRTVVEFGLARSVGRPASILVAELRRAARGMGASRPPLDTDAGIRWPAVDTAWANFAGWNLAPDVVAGLPPAEQA